MATNKFNPNSELVAVTFIRSLALGPSATFGVGATLPEDMSTWKDGFVQLQVVGGSPSIDVPTRRPLVQVDCWVPSINSSKPQWGKANTIADDIIAQLYLLEHKGVKVTPAGNFKEAFVQSAYASSEPRKVSNDPAGHARYTFDMTLTWVTSEPNP